MKEFVEKLIERLEELQEIEGKKCDKYAKLNMGDYVEKYNHGECCYIKAIQIVNQLAEEYNQGWILCSDKLPIFEGFYRDVITTDESGVVEVAFYNNHEKEWYKSDAGYEGEYEVKRDIIAWRNLPEPYKTEEKQEEV